MNVSGWFHDAVIAEMEESHIALYRIEELEDRRS